MDKVGNILVKAMASKGLAGAALSSQACFLAEKWGKGRLKAISMSRGTLKLSVRSAAAAQELSMDSQKIIEHINEKMGKEFVKKVRIVNAD